MRVSTPGRAAVPMLRVLVVGMALLATGPLHAEATMVPWTDVAAPHTVALPPEVADPLGLLASLELAAAPEVAATSRLTATMSCRIRCGLVLGATSFTLATGSVVTWGRITGGLQSPSQGKTIWAISFGTSLATAAALYGSRRERTIYASGLGAAAGALLGFTVEAVAGRGESSTKVAATLIGAALGAVAGGIYGAFSEEESAAGAALAAQRAPMLEIRIPF
jgi:outer membrane lipoprotein SlyB